MMTLAPAANYEDLLARYRAGVWRDRIFLDMIAAEMPTDAVVLDIGCGRGFDGDIPLQEEMAGRAGRFVGIEPDKEIPLGAYFHETHRCLFEDAPLEDASIDVAYAIMVLEHLPDPKIFFDKLQRVLKPGGVFWGLTVDRRHFFCRASRWFDRLHLKTWYLNRLMGKRGEERYENYPVYYRCNAPEDLERVAPGFAERQAYNFSREGQLDAYFPRLLRPLGRWMDRRALRRGQPGTLLALRVKKA